jgi:hypothetical protein
MLRTTPCLAFALAIGMNQAAAASATSGAVLTVVRPTPPPIPSRLLEALQRSLATTDTMLDVESRLVFVCGARPAKDKDGARGRLIQYARKHIKVN